MIVVEATEINDIQIAQHAASSVCLGAAGLRKIAKIVVDMV